MPFLKSILCSLLLLSAARLMAEQGKPAIERAAQNNKSLFVFFYTDQNERTLSYQKIFDETMHKLGERISFVKVKANDPSESRIIEKFGLKRSPMPLVLVVAPNGAISGGFPSAFTEQQLVDSIASPGMASCLQALQDKKMVFVCLQNAHTKGNEAALQGVKDFHSDSRFGNATKIVVIDPTDTNEHKFLNQLGVDTHTTQAQTVFLAPPGDPVGRYSGATSKDRFIADLQKAVSGCCPGGCCSGGCCPNGKCK